LRELPKRYSFRRFIPSLSTTAPAKSRSFFEELLRLRLEVYPRDFQMQFSIHSTDEKQRDDLMPVPKWTLPRIAEYGEKFFQAEGQKISLNFALGEGWERDCDKLKRYFNPEKFLIKITPVNPTFSAERSGIACLIRKENGGQETVEKFQKAGYDVILSIGEREENRIGSNCGQYISAVRNAEEISQETYSYRLVDLLKPSS